MEYKMLAQINKADYVPKRFALKFGASPTIILEYLVPSSGKLFHHKMRLKNLHKASNPNILVDELIKKHELYLNHSKLCKSQLVKLVTKLISKQREKLEEIDYNQMDLNKLNDEELKLHKKKMDEVYKKNYKTPETEGFVYDIEQDFEPDEQVDNSWDT